AGPETARPPVVRVIATDAGFEMPARIPAGITEVRLINRGTTWHEGVFERFLTPDATASDFVDSIRAGVDVPVIGEDSGGPGLALPGDSTAVWMELRPGRYAVTCWYASHLESGAIREFEIVPSRAHAEPPSADLGVRMRDFTYDFSGVWSAGKHCVRVE